MSSGSVSGRRKIMLSGAELFLPQRRVIAMVKSANWMSAINRKLPSPEYQTRWVAWGQWETLDQQVRTEGEALVVIEVPAASSAAKRGGGVTASTAEVVGRGPVRCLSAWMSQRRLRRQCIVAVITGEESEVVLSVRRHGLAQLGVASCVSSFAELDRLPEIAERNFQNLRRVAGAAGNCGRDASELPTALDDEGAMGEGTLEDQVDRNLPWE